MRLARLMCGCWAGVTGLGWMAKRISESAGARYPRGSEFLDDVDGASMSSAWQRSVMILSVSTGVWMEGGGDGGRAGIIDGGRGCLAEAIWACFL